MNITEKNIVGELVAQDYRTALVFKNHDIDFCCNGNRTIEETCENKNMESGVLIEKLRQAVQQNSNIARSYNLLPLDLLADHIEKKHHYYVEQKIQEITPFLNKVLRIHGDRHPELSEIKQLFGKTADELTAHIKKEELVLFPFIRKMAKAKQDNIKIERADFGTVRGPVKMMMNEHAAESERLRKIAELTQNYTPPTDARNTYRITFALLKEFEEDLRLHIHLENNILFPKAIELEKSVYKWTTSL